MKITTRRRLAFGAAALSTAVVAGLVVAPTASAGAASVTPQVAANNEASKTLTFSTTADFTAGGSGEFTRIGSATSTVDITIDPSPGKGKTPTGSADFTDGGDYVGVDGPADAGQYDMSITSDDPVQPSASQNATDTCSNCFTVVPAGTVSITGATPSSMTQNSAGNVTFSGDNFERGSRIAVLLPSGAVDTSIDANGEPTDANGTKIKTVTTRTTLLRRVIVPTTATTGPRGLRVTNLDGTTASCSACFVINGAPLTNVSPTGASNDPNRTPALTNLKFIGSALQNGEPSLVYVGDPGSSTKSALTIVGTNPVYNANKTELTADFDLRSAAPGDTAYVPTITAADGSVNSCTCKFGVVQTSAPTVTSLDSDTSTATIDKEQKAGTTKTFVVTGTNFSRGVRIVVSGTGVTTTAVQFVDPTHVRATLVTASSAAPGDRDVTATTTDGKVSAVCSKCYTVTASSTGSPSATPTSTISPTGSSCRTPSIVLTGGDKQTVKYGDHPTARVYGAEGESIAITGYSRPSKQEGVIHGPRTVGSAGYFTTSFTAKTNTRLYAVATCGARSPGVVFNVRALLTIDIHHTSGAHWMTFSGTVNPGAQGQAQEGRPVTLYEQKSGQAGKALKTKSVRKDGTYYFVWKFTDTHTSRFFVRTENDYINFSSETLKYSKSTY